MTIFQGKRELQISALTGWVVAVNDKAWMREDVMLRWIREILRPYTQRRPSLLVLDSFSAHITLKVREELCKIQCHPSIIPGGCTTKAQPLDVAINKPFKDRVRKLWMQYMQDRQEALSIDGLELKCPSHKDLVIWIHEATQRVKETGVIPKAFKVTGILNALSGTEDKMIRDDTIIPMDNTHDEDFDDNGEFCGFGNTDFCESEDPFIDVDEVP